MSRSPKEGRVSPACDPTAPGEQFEAERQSDRDPRVGGAAAYYRLRSIALETRVEQLEAELEQTEKRLQETIAQYERILQCRAGRDAVVTVPAETPDAASASDD